MKDILEQLENEEMLNDSILNSYYVLTGKATVENIIKRQEFPMFFINLKLNLMLIICVVRLMILILMKFKQEKQKIVGINI